MLERGDQLENLIATDRNVGRIVGDRAHGGGGGVKVCFRGYRVKLNGYLKPYCWVLTSYQ